MRRLDDWDVRLADYIAARETLAFAWGVQDCVTFARGAVEAITGDDAGVTFRVRWATAIGAAKALKRFGGGGVEQMMERVADENCLKEVPVLMAQRGDVLVLPSQLVYGECAQISGPLALAIVDMDGAFAVLPGADGLVRVPVRFCKRAWRIA